MRLLYTIALHLYALTFLPWVMLRFREKFKMRLGVGFPLIEQEGKPIAWVHAVSVGETRAVAPLVAKLKAKYRVLLSTVTLTGHAEGLSSVDADWFVYLPFDLPYIIRPIVRRVSPKLLILTETDFWYHFEDEAKACGAHIVLVNGKISLRSYKRLCKLPALAKLLFAPIDLFCLQSPIYEERFLQLLVPPEKIMVTGNLKLDATFAAPLASQEQILTLGSTHDPEERIWLEILPHLPSLKLYIAPRHPERFDKVAKLLTHYGISFGRSSKGETFSTYNVILIDQMGKLRECYRESTLAFVGGSFTPHVGGHNLLEPCFFGVPVLYGPHTHNQPDLAELMRRYHAGVEVTKENLLETVRDLLGSVEQRNELSLGGKKLLLASSGALEKTFHPIDCIK